MTLFLLVLDIPLLFEKGGWRKVGAIAVVSAPAWMQRRRVMRRPGMKAAKLKANRRLQVSDRVKRARADLIIETGRSEEHTSELQSIMRTSYAVFCLQKKKTRPLQ